MNACAQINDARRQMLIQPANGAGFCQGGACVFLGLRALECFLIMTGGGVWGKWGSSCLLYTSDAADE